MENIQERLRGGYRIREIMTRALEHEMLRAPCRVWSVELVDGSDLNVQLVEPVRFHRIDRTGTLLQTVHSCV